MTEPDIEDSWEHAPCGHILAAPDGRMLRVNATLASWLGYDRQALRHKAFTDLLTVGGRIHYETHFGPLLHMSGEFSGITMDLVAADGTRLPMFLTANVHTDQAGTPSHLRIVVQDASDRRSYERELLEQRRRAETEHTRVQQFAETLRRSLLPPMLSPPQGMEAADFYFAASRDDIGGDFYDLFPLSRTTWGFFLGDVSGKGVDAAVVTALTRYTLRAAAVFDDEPTEVLRNLDTVLAQNFADSTRFCTVIFGRITVRDMGFDVEMASGGHPPPLLLYADGSAYYADTTGGQAVGIVPNPKFMATRLRLRAGDTLVLYTDGLTEASTGIGRERYDDEGALLDFARAHTPTTATGIVDAIRVLLERLGSGVEDDTAVLALSVPAQPWNAASNSDSV